MTTTKFHDFPLAPRDREWDGDAAERRVRTWADAEDGPNERYRDAHVWYDDAKAETYGAYKLLIADVVDGDLKVVPRAVMSAAGVVDGARGGVDIPRDELDRVRAHLRRYYEKLGDEPPWES